MIEVYPHGNGWAWRMISAAGRILWEHPEQYAEDRIAFEDAKRWRIMWFTNPCDHRPGACL